MSRNCIKKQIWEKLSDIIGTFRGCEGFIPFLPLKWKPVSETCIHQEFPFGATATAVSITFWRKQHIQLLFFLKSLVLNVLFVQLQIFITCLLLILLANIIKGHGQCWWKLTWILASLAHFRLRVMIHTALWSSMSIGTPLPQLQPWMVGKFWVR